MLLETKDPLECPKCGKKVLVQQGSDRYRCLWCGFDRDLSEPEVGGILPFLAIGTLILLILIL